MVQTAASASKGWRGKVSTTNPLSKIVRGRPTIAATGLKKIMDTIMRKGMQVEMQGKTTIRRRREGKIIKPIDRVPMYETNGTGHYEIKEISGLAREMT